MKFTPSGAVYMRSQRYFDLQANLARYFWDKKKSALGRLEAKQIDESIDMGPWVGPGRDEED
jgi:hypothetical protein